MRKSWDLKLPSHLSLCDLDESSLENISSLVGKGFTSCELIINEERNGFWNIDINDNEQDDLYLEHISSKITEGFTSGID